MFVGGLGLRLSVGLSVCVCVSVRYIGYCVVCGKMSVAPRAQVFPGLYGEDERTSSSAY